jgi:hypothetical protein
MTESNLFIFMAVPPDYLDALMSTPFEMVPVSDDEDDMVYELDRTDGDSPVPTIEIDID